MRKQTEVANDKINELYKKYAHGGIKQHTIDIMEEAQQFASRQENPEYREIEFYADEIFSRAGRIDNLLEVINPELKQDIEFLKALHDVYEVWAEVVLVENRSIGFDRHQSPTVADFEKSPTPVS